MSGGGVDDIEARLVGETPAHMVEASQEPGRDEVGWHYVDTPARAVPERAAPPDPDEKPLFLCRAHFRGAVDLCADCGAGLCTDCVTAGGVPPLCAHCMRTHQERLEFVRIAEESRLAMRKAGIRTRRRAGEPVILWEGPLRLVLPIAGGIAAAILGGVAAAEVRMHWGVDATLTALALGVVVGILVRNLFGGVSYVAGLVAAGIVTVAILEGRWFAGSTTPADAPLGLLNTASDWLAVHGPAALATALVSAGIAYTAASGRRLA